MAAALLGGAKSGSVWGLTNHCGCAYSCTGLRAAATSMGCPLRRKGRRVVVVVGGEAERSGGDCRCGCRTRERGDRSKYIFWL